MRPAHFDSRSLHRRRPPILGALAISSLLLAACEESFEDDGAGGSGATSTVAGVTSSPSSTATGFGGGFEEEGVAVSVAVPESGRAFVDLESAAVTDVDGAWDLAFEGVDVFTHGGVTAEGDGAAFGPYAAPQFLSDDRPEVPFQIEDHTGGAFIDWYVYDGASHTLWSRHHVIGVRRGETRYKVQVLGFYGEVQGAPVSGVYSIRVATVGGSGTGETVTIEGIDGTAGGSNPDETAPSGCLTLASGTVALLTPAEAQLDSSWDLCFRRDQISVNGELGGPGGVLAVNLDAPALPDETPAEVMARTASSELGRFEAVGPEELDDPSLVWRGDRIVSAFSDAWLVPGSSPLAPEAATWFVVGGDGIEYLVAFHELTGATADRVGTVNLRVKRIAGE